MRINSYDKLVANWRRLLFKVTDYEAELPHTGFLKRELQAHLEALEAAKAHQQVHRAALQQATQEIRKWEVSGRRLACRLRCQIKADWGHSDQRLLEFGIEPAGNRRAQKSPGCGLGHPKPNGSERPM
jgi:hypothetical protein